VVAGDHLEKVTIACANCEPAVARLNESTWSLELHTAGNEAGPFSFLEVSGRMLKTLLQKRQVRKIDLTLVSVSTLLLVIASCAISQQAGSRTAR
jgi:hypothetical protein